MVGIATTIAKIRRVVPESEDRWDDATVIIALWLADATIRETCEMDWNTQDITLIPNCLYYELNDDAIGVGAVLYSTDGTNFDQYPLAPADLDDLDCRDREWRDRTGTRPELYYLLGAPGVESSRVLLWPPLSTVTTEKVRLVYLRCCDKKDLTFAAERAPEWIIDRVYVPLTLALLYAGQSPAEAKMYLDSAMNAMSTARSLYTEKYGDSVPVDSEVNVSRLGGQV